MMKTVFVFLPLISLLGLHGQQEKKLDTGLWRALLERPDGNQIVFNFEVRDSIHRQVIYIRNAAERLLVDDIGQQKDSLLIGLPFFDSQIHAFFVNDHELRGRWVKRLTDSNQVIAFSAFFDQPYRWLTAKENIGLNVSGRWAVSFQKDSLPSVGEFEQQGTKISGTFLNPTGDYRYLQGVVDGDSLKLSCFDGGHAYLFLARIEDTRNISGQYFSGPTFKESWKGRRDDSARLPDEFSLTKLKKGESRLDFAFRDIDGITVSIHDARFKNKVLLVQMMGSWCPNCMDETRLLSSLYDKYHPRGLEIIGLAYERSTDFARSQKSVRSFQMRFHVHYPLLITGVTQNDSLLIEKTLPQLEKLEGFPTTIFIDKRGEVQKIHTGFNGPATGAHYEEEKKTFTQIIDKLLVE